MPEESDLASIVRIELSSLPKDATTEQAARTIRACLVREVRHKQEREIQRLTENAKPATRSAVTSEIGRRADAALGEIAAIAIKATPCRGDQRFEATLSLSGKTAQILGVTTPFEV